jgi:hypothetical protein
VSEVVDALVLRSLRKRPERRFASAAEMAAVAKRVLDGLAPGFGAADLAACLAAALRQGPAADEDATSAADVGAGRPEPLPPPPPEDEARVDLLTRWDLPSPDPEAPAPPPLAIPVGPPAPGVVSVPTRELRGLRRRSRGVALALLGACALSGAAALVLDNGAAPARDETPATTSVRVAVASAPPPPAPEAPGAVPAAASVPVRSEPPRPERDAGIAASARVTTEPSRPASEPVPRRRDPPPAGPGFVTITALPWAWVEVDGRPLEQQTPITRMPLPAGRHVVRLSSPDRSASVERVVEVRPGRPSQVSHQFP